MIHLMVLPNPDPMEGRPEVGAATHSACSPVHSCHSRLTCTSATQTGKAMIGPQGVHLWHCLCAFPVIVSPRANSNCLYVQHGGQDRHVAVGVESVDALQGRLEDFSIPFTRSKSGRKAIFFRDPGELMSSDVLAASGCQISLGQHVAPAGLPVDSVHQLA